MLEASLPEKFWPYSLIMATTIVNRLPSPVLDWKTPFEVLHKKQPNYSLIKVFGCLAYATNVKPHKGKFETIAYKCVYLGLSTGQKAYKLYNIDTNQVFISRDVIFHEKMYPFDKQVIEDKITPLPVIEDEEIDNTNDIETTVQDTPPEDEGDHTEGIIEATQRRSTREKQRPRWMEDFVVNASIDNLADKDSITPGHGYTPCTYPYTIATSFDSAYINFLANISSVTEPRTYEQANKSEEWRQAMKQEIDALEKNRTWEITELPAGKQAIGSRWVYKIKHKADGSVERYKARLVAKG